MSISVPRRARGGGSGGRGSLSAPLLALTPTPSPTQPLVTPAALKDALERVRREFEFNISATHHFNISLGASKSLGEVATDIMEGVRLRLEPTRRVLGLFLHFSFCAILYLYLQ